MGGGAKYVVIVSIVIVYSYYIIALCLGLNIYW